MKKNLKSTLNAAKKICFLSFLAFLSTCLLPAESRAVLPCNPCNMCDLHGERGDLLDSITYTVVDNVSPTEVDPKEILTIHGQGFDNLPPIGTKVELFGLVNRNGSCTSDVVYVDPVFRLNPADGRVLPFLPNEIQVELPRDWIHTNGGTVGYSNFYTIAQVAMIYETPGVCSSGIRNFTEVSGGVIFGFQGPIPSGYCVASPSVYIIDPEDFHGTVVNSSEIELTWGYDGLYTQDIDGFNFYMHWCQPQIENCAAINPADYGLNDTKPDMSGTPRNFWEPLRDQNGNPVLTGKFIRDVTVRSNPNGTPSDWSHSTLFIAISAFRGNGESEPAYLTLTIP